MDTTLLEEQDMALRNEDRAWIQDEIHAAIQERLQPNGWSRLGNWLKEWLPLAGVFGVLVALLALAGSGWKYALSRVEQEARFEVETSRRLDSIENTLRSLRATQSPGPVLNEISKLDPKTFAMSLPTLQKIGEYPPAEVKPSREILQKIADKLRNTDPQSEGYWPAVLQFLTFASAGLSTDVPPARTPDIVISNNTAGISIGLVKKEVVLLDGGELQDSRFENSRIVFTANPVILKNVAFVNCVFQMPVVTDPNGYLKKASHILLASELNSAFFAPL